jgi:hypothetical protein
MSGFGSVGAGSGDAGGTPFQAGQLAVFGPGEALTISAAPAREQESRSPNLEVLLLGGRPIGEPVAWMGPFVMNTRDELVQAVRDFHAGRLGTVPAVSALSHDSAAAAGAPRITAIHGAPTSIEESRRPD